MPRRSGETPVTAVIAGQEDGSKSMPRYEFICHACKKPFELAMTISAREKAKIRCPKCKGTRVAPQLATFMAQTARKS